MSDVLTFDNLETENPEEGVLDFRDLIHDAEQKKLEAEGPGAWAGQPKTGFLGAFGKGFIEPMQATGRGPGLAVLSHDTLKEHLLDQYARKTTEPQLTPGGRAGSFLGGLVGNIAQALPVARAAGTIGLMAQFGSASAYDEFLNAGMRALQEGKSPDEATTIGREAALAGLGVGAALGAIMPGAGGGAKELLKTSLKLGGVAGAGRVGENITEKALGLKTPVTEGALREALVMGLMPPGMKLAGLGLKRAFAGMTPPPLPPETPRTPLALPERTGPIEMGGISGPPSTMSGIEELLRRSPVISARELPSTARLALPERTGAIPLPDVTKEPTWKPPKTLAEVEELLRRLPPNEETVRKIDFEKARAELVALEQAEAAAGPKPLTENQMRLIAPSLMEALGAKPYEKSGRPKPTGEKPPSEEPPTGEAGVPVGQPPKPPAPAPPAQPAAPAAEPKEANAVAPRIEQESREPEHPGVAQRPAVSPDQPEVRQVEGGQAGGGNRPERVAEEEKPVLLTKEPVAEPAGEPPTKLSKSERDFAEELSKKYGSPVAPETPATEPHESLSRFSNMLERAADKSNDASELSKILDGSYGKPDESRIAWAVANNPHADAATFSRAKANPDLRRMTTDENISRLDARREQLRKQRGLEPPAPKPKEAWEMTMDEYGSKRAAIRRVFQKWKDWDHANKSPSTATKAYQKWLDKRIKAFREIEESEGVLPLEVQKGFTGDYGADVAHEAHIKKALREGKPVPPEVLKDYPELQAKAEPTITREEIVKHSQEAGTRRALIRKQLDYDPKNEELKRQYHEAEKEQDKWDSMLPKKEVPSVLEQWAQPTTPAEGVGKAPGKRRKTLKEIREQNKLGGEGGFITIPPVVVDKIERLRDQIATAWRTGKVRAAMTYTKDAAMNAADRYANEVGNGVRNMLYRGTGTKFDPTKEGGQSNILTPWKDPNAVQKAALTVGVESFSDAPAGSPEAGFTGVDRMRMQQARLSAWTPPTAELGKWKDLALSGLDYAIRNWSRIEPTVRRYQAETRAQADSEIANGVDTLIRNGYVLHETDLEGVSPFDFLTGKRGTENASFLKNRVYPTYVDKIMSGSVPKSMDAIGLLKRRVQVGQRKINNRAWTQQMRSVLDETSGNPILTEPNYQTRADGKTYPVAPTSDYTVVHMGFEPYAIHKGYESVFDLLNSPSRFANSLAGQTLMKAVGSTKHIVLAFDTFHLGRLALWSTILQGKPVGYKKGLVLLDYSLPEILEMIRRGEVPAEYGADLAENKRQLNLATKTGYNMTRIQDALWQDWVQKIPVSGAFNKWLFGQFQRGAMVESWLHEFQRQRRENPTMPEMDVARKVSKELNTRFGNLQNQGVFRSKTLQDVARFTFLAPQWNEGLIKSEIGALTGLGKTGYDLATKQKLAMNAFTRSAGILFLAQFAANQLINYVTRGHSTLDNPEDGPDAKLSAYVPDVVGEGPGLFISPMALPMETAHLIYKRFEKSKDFDEALRQYARTRLGTVSRPIYTWATSTDMFGRQIRSEELWKEVAKAAAPAPISGSAAFQAGRQLATGEKAEQFPGQFQRQAMASIGVKTEAAPTAVQQISSLARDFNKARGVRDAGRFPQSDYANLERYLRVGNVQDAAKELEEVRKKNPDTRIQKHFEALPKASFTRSSSDIEARFYNKLTDDQKKAYINARRERMELARRFWQLWPRREMNRPAPPE